MFYFSLCSFLFFICTLRVHLKDPPGGSIKGARTWGPSTYHQRERGALVEFPAQPKSAGEQAAFSKSAPNLEKTKPPLSSLSPLPQRMQRRAVGTSSATSLGKSHDEGLNRIKGKKLSTSQYYRGHTTNLCTGISNSSPFKIMLSEGAGGSGGMLLRHVPRTSSSSASVGVLAEREEEGGGGCFGLIRGSGASSNGSGSVFSSARHHKKFSLDQGVRDAGDGGPPDVTYDIAFYRKMQQSVDELFDEKRFAKTNHIFNSKSSGDLVNSDESFSESHDSSEFRRECFFNKSAPGGSLPKSGNEKFQYLSLNDLLATKTTTVAAVSVATEQDLYGEQSVGSAQNSSSSSSSHTTTASLSSRKNSQVSFEEGRSSAKAGCSVKLPPMKSEVSPRKFEKIYNMGTVDGPSLLGGTHTKRQKAGFITSLFKKGHRSVEKRTAKREGRMGDEKINLVADDNEEQEEAETNSRQHQPHHGGRTGGEDRMGNTATTTYDMIYTKRHIIAKQSAPDQSLFRSDSH